MDEYIKGGIVGGSTVILGYPLDTIKTIKQNKQTIKYSIRNLYRGIVYPLSFSVIFNSTLFTLHGKFYKKLDNHYYSGFLAGALSAPLLNTIELYKVNKQLGRSIDYKKPFKGCLYTILREGSASSFYFGAYFYLKEKNIHPMISGGSAGVLSWLFSYPIDTIKTRIQSGECLNFKEAFKKGGIFNGLSYCLIRAGIVNSFGFYIYESL